MDALGVTSGYSAGFSTGFACLTGVFVLALFALLSACYLAAETDTDVSNDFCKRGYLRLSARGVRSARARSGRWGVIAWPCAFYLYRVFRLRPPPNV